MSLCEQSTSEDKTRSKSKSRKGELTEEQRKEVINAFRIFDTEKKGQMQQKDLKAAMRVLGFEPRKEEISKMTSQLKLSTNSFITEDQFIKILSTKMAEKDTSEEISRAFRLFDDEQTGKITLKSLKKIAKELGENISDQELMEMIAEADLNKDGVVTEDEFYKIMKATNLY